MPDGADSACDPAPACDVRAPERCFGKAMDLLVSEKAISFTRRSRALPENSEEHAHPPRRVGRRGLALGRRRLPPARLGGAEFFGGVGGAELLGERRRGGDERLQRRLARVDVVGGGGGGERRRRRARRRAPPARAPPGGEPCAWSWRRDMRRKHARRRCGVRRVGALRHHAAGGAGQREHRGARRRRPRAPSA